LNVTAAFIEAARGLSHVDLLLTNARIVNVFNGEIEHGNVAVHQGRVVGIGDYRLAREIIDLDGRYLLPGYINGHTHIESSMLDINRYAEAVISRGTLGVVTDLHEIANVCGMRGIEYILDSARRLPFSLFVMAPSCVPATAMETSGASLSAGDTRSLLRRKGVIGLGEMMNFPGVLAGDGEVLAKINAAASSIVDGHAPGLGAFDLNAYIGAGASSDHESVSLEEAREKLARGMYVMIREGSSEKNLEELLPLVSDKTYKRCLFVVDDRSCADLLYDGDVDAIVRKAIRLGLEPVRAVQMASINAAERFDLKHVGAVAPGYYADLQVVSDINRPEADLVFRRGRLVARGGKAVFKVSQDVRPTPGGSFNVGDFGTEHLRLKPKSAVFPVIEVVPGQIITRKLETEPPLDGSGFIAADIERDILKLAVVERHAGSGNVGVGLVKGFGFKCGALASSVAHDSHNIVAVGTCDADLTIAIREVVRMQGGLAVVSQGRVLKTLALPIAGLMSDRPLSEVAAVFGEVGQAARDVGCVLAAPFAVLSFLALPVIPELRLTDRGLVDVNTFRFIG